MRPSWEALSARARGLSTHLLADQRLHELEQAGDLAEVLRRLRGTPYERWLPAHESAADALEIAVVRSLADRLATLSRWACGDARALLPLFLEQDARTIRTSLRGTVGSLTTQQRLADSIPTPLLGRRALEVLARAESAGAVAATLTGWGHPFGSALLEEAGRKHPDLLRLERALARRLTTATLSAAKRSGRRVLEFVRRGIDADNIVAALLLAGAQREGEPLDHFLEGGVVLRRDDFSRAARAPNRTASADILARATRGTLFAPALSEPPPVPAAVAARVSSARIDEMSALGRREPVSAAPVLLFVLRLRKEARQLRRALWLAALTSGRRA